MLRLPRAFAPAVATCLSLFAVSACGDRAMPSAPERLAAPAASHAVIPTVVIARAPIVRRTARLDNPEYACGVLTPTLSGGSLSLNLRKAGLKVIFYDGAVTGEQWVCIVAHPGELLTYSFYPHGLQFATAVKVQQDLHGTTAWRNSAVMGNMMGGYLPNGVEHDVDAAGVGSFAQVFDVVYADETGTFTKTTPALVKFYTNHFSGYALASGRASAFVE